ncbi:Kynureninase [Paracoccus halophilus]|uniref:Kynureninase n=1 Tax=Paracoccus halophilus TaxID=376733 RepID=A0A099EXE2_9RHOB|nr:aminotransferase class V-fold PLP-dependent enzyme [Paracoccus halophilus]KGJ03080.1 hypothetical protein IT41_15310 [Paracoccus halophilus]SFA53130.1 Kynureninase [Paracoccus halophilus]
MDRHDGYFLYHSIGHFPDKAARLTAALTEFAQKWAAGGDGQWPYCESVERGYLDRWTRLLGAGAGTVAHAESVTSAMHALISALPEQVLRGKRVVMPADGFPSLVFLLTGLADRYGFALDLVPLREGAFWVECDDIAARIDGTAGLVLLNWVSSTSSHKCNVPRLTRLAHQAGALVGLDMTQGAGILPFDVAKVPVDFAASTSLKWVCGVPGAGILYATHDLIRRCIPERRGWFSQGNPFNWTLSEFALAGDARRFHLGTPSVLGCAGTLPALDWVLSGGAEEAREKNVKIVDAVIGIADELGLSLASPREDHRRGASIMLHFPGDTRAKAALHHLAGHGIHADARGEVLRLSPGISTSPAMLDHLRDGLAGIPKGGR